MRITPFVRSVNLSVAIIFLVTSTTYGVPRSLWDSQKESPPLPVPSAVEGEKGGEGGFFIDPAKLIVPENFGSITERFKSAGTENSQKLIIQIQDSHCNYEAQTNISSIIETMSADKDTAKALKLIATEGAQGLVDPTFVRSFPDPKIRQEATNYFVKIGWLTGTESYAINFKDEPLPLWGIEDKSLYDENLDCFRKTKTGLSKEKEFLDKLTGVIEVLKTKTFSKGLGELVGMREKWDKNTIPFTEYCAYLASLAVPLNKGGKGVVVGESQTLQPPAPPFLRGIYPNLTTVIESIQIEKKIDPKKIDPERKALVAALQKAMVKEELSELVKQSLYLRTGKITSDMFYAFLREAAAAKKIDMAKYPDLAGYMEIVEKNSKVSAAELFDEVERIEKTIKNKMYSSQDEKELDEIIGQVKILKNLLALRMSRRDLTYYNEHKKELALAEILKKLSKITHIPPPSWGRGREGALNFSPCENFYSAAIKRDKVLAEKTLNEMEKRKATAVAVVTGGFHTQGLKELFKAKGYSYVVVTPRMTQAYDDKVYLTRMLNEQSEFDKLFANTGNRLAVWSILNTPECMRAFQVYAMAIASASPERARRLKEKWLAVLLQLPISDQERNLLEDIVKSIEVKKKNEKYEITLNLNNQTVTRGVFELNNEGMLIAVGIPRIAAVEATKTIQSYEMPAPVEMKSQEGVSAAGGFHKGAGKEQEVLDLDTLIKTAHEIGDTFPLKAIIDNEAKKLEIDITNPNVKFYSIPRAALKGKSAYWHRDKGQVHIFFANDIEPKYMAVNARFEMKKAIMGMNHMEAMEWELIEEDIKNYAKYVDIAALEQLTKEWKPTDADRARYKIEIAAGIKNKNPRIVPEELDRQVSERFEEAIRKAENNAQKASVNARAALSLFSERHLTGIKYNPSAPDNFYAAVRELARRARQHSYNLIDKYKDILECVRQIPEVDSYVDDITSIIDSLRYGNIENLHKVATILSTLDDSTLTGDNLSWALQWVLDDLQKLRKIQSIKVDVGYYMFELIPKAAEPYKFINFEKFSYKDLIEQIKQEEKAAMKKRTAAFNNFLLGLRYALSGKKFKEGTLDLLIKDFYSPEGVLSDATLFELQHGVLSYTKVNIVISLFNAFYDKGGVQGDTFNYVFSKGLEAVNHLVNSWDDLLKISADLVQLGKSAQAGIGGSNAKHLFISGLPALSHLIKTRQDLVDIGTELIEFAKTDKDKIGEADIWYMYSSLAELKDVIKSRDDLKKAWRKLVDLNKKAREKIGEKNAEYLFTHGLPVVLKMYNTQENWDTIMDGLIGFDESERAEIGDDNIKYIYANLMRFKDLIRYDEDLSDMRRCLVSLCGKARYVGLKDEDIRLILLYGLPALKEAVINPKIITIDSLLIVLCKAAGNRAEMLFKDILPEFKEKFGAEWIFDNSYLIEECGKAAGEGSVELLKDALPKLKDGFGAEWINRHERGLIEMCKSAKGDSVALLGDILPKLKEEFGVEWINERWDEVIELGKSSRISFVDLFTNVLPKLKENFGVGWIDSNWKTLLSAMGRLTLTDSMFIVKDILPELKDKYGADWVAVHLDLIVNAGQAAAFKKDIDVKTLLLKIIPECVKEHGLSWVNDHLETIVEIGDGRNIPGVQVPLVEPGEKQPPAWTMLNTPRFREMMARILGTLSDGVITPEKEKECGNMLRKWAADNPEARLFIQRFQYSRTGNKYSISLKNSNDSFEVKLVNGVIDIAFLPGLKPIPQMASRPAGLPPIQEDSELSLRVEPLLDARRSLIVSSNPEAIDQSLAGIAKKRGVKYLRLSLRDQKEFDRLMSRIRIHDGKWDKAQGDIPDIIRNGGILLIDYSNSSPQLIEQFNSLFDKDPYFADIRASQKLSIVGVTSAGQFSESDSTFRSRFVKTASFEPGLYEDPVGAIGEPPPGTAALKALLSGSPYYRDELLGKAYLDENGKLQISEGPLMRAVRENRPLVIEGGNWEDPAFVSFIRQMILHSSVLFNGETVSFPNNFAIYTRHYDYSGGIERKRVVAPGEVQLSGEPLWIVNEENQDILFSRTHVKNGKLTQLPGILDGKKLRLRITGKVADWVWHRIMHASGEIEIEVMNEAHVPEVYAAYKSALVKKAVPEKKPKSFAEAKSARGVYIEGDDPGYIRARVEEEYGKDVLFYPVTPETNMTQIISSIEIAPAQDGSQLFRSAEKGIAAALRAGKTIVIDGIESNPALLEKLSTALCESPYIIENGERVDLAGLPGRLIIASRSQKGPLNAVENRVAAQPDEESFVRLMNSVNKGHQRRPLSKDDLRKLKQIEEIFRSIPAPPVPGLYPHSVNLTFDRIALLCRYDNWLQAFEEVVIAPYSGSPEVAAFMRVMVRLSFNVEEEGRRPHSVHGRKLMRVINGVPPGEGWDACFWEIADTLSLDVLKSSGVGNAYTAPVRKEALRRVEESLAKHSDGERQAFYRARFGISGDTGAAPDIDMETRAGEENWQQRMERAVRTLKNFKAAFFRGPPGTGKSYISEVIAKEMGYAPENIIGPITTGVDASEAGMVARQEYKDGMTRIKDEAVGLWVPPSPAGVEGPPARKGKIFIIDEANLAKPQFWNFMRAFFHADPKKRYVWVNGERRWFNDEDRVVFTGNQETLPGRKFQELIGEQMVTINFTSFDEPFLRERLNEYLHATKVGREKMIDVILDLYRLFEKVNPAIDYSLRDLQEISARMNTFLGPKWSIEDVLRIAWSQYRGCFTADEADALKHLLAKRYGVDVSELLRERVRQVAGDEGKRQAYRKGGVEFVPSVAQVACGVEDFLRIRDARMSGKSTIQGKRGMVFEGPSGRGKDAVLTQILKENGIVNARDARPDTPAVRKYYHVNASVRIDDMIAVIKKAQTEGSIVIISEMNLLPSAFLEGKLNDLLTGKAEQGFALFATMNSEDFSGREKLSSALMNRIIYQKVSDYTQDEFRQIAAASRGTASEGDAVMLANAHAWIREQVKRANQKPTTRDLLHALALMKEKKVGWRAAVEEVYGPFYLERALAGQAVPADDALAAFREKSAVNNAESLRLLGSYLIGKPTQVCLDAVTKQGGYHEPVNNTITLSAQMPPESQLHVFDHEAGHGRFTRDIPGVLARDDKSHWIYMWLEDMRMEHAMKQFYPRTTLDDMDSYGGQGRSFVNAVRGLDADYLFKMTPQNLFLYILSSYAQGRIDEQDVDALAELMEGAYPVNIVLNAKKHLASARAIYGCVPSTLDEEEILFQQYRALALMGPMMQDYIDIYAFFIPPDEKEDVPQDKKEELLDMAMNEMNKGEMQPKVSGEKREEPKSAPMSAEEKKALIEKKRGEMKRLRADAGKKTKEDVNAELASMDRELNDVRISTKRIEEILALLTNEHHPASLVRRAKQLGEAALMDKIGQLVDKVHKVEDDKRMMALRQQKQMAKRGGAEGAGQRGDAGGRREMPGSDSVASAHKQGKQQTEGVALQKKKPAPRSMPLAAKETALHNPALARITKTEQPLLDDAIADFFRRRMTVERQYGPEGTLDMDRFLSVGGNPSEAHYRSGGAEEREAKEIVLSGPVYSQEWNPILEELFLYLFENGFAVTAYVSDDSYVENIRTLADLKNVMSRSMDVGPETVRSDMASRKRPEQYVYSTLPDLQKKVEAAYLYGAMKGAARGDIEQAEPALKGEDTWGYNWREIKKILQSKGLKDGFNDDFRESGNTDEIGKGRSLSIMHKKSLSLTDLAKFPNLQSIDLGEQADEKSIYELFVLHPGRETLTVSAPMGNSWRKYRIDDLPPEYRARIEQTDFDRQVRDLKSKIGADNMAVDYIRKRIKIKLQKGFDLSLLLIYPALTEIVYPRRDAPNISEAQLADFLRNHPNGMNIIVAKESDEYLTLLDLESDIEYEAHDEVVRQQEKLTEHISGSGGAVRILSGTNTRTNKNIETLKLSLDSEDDFDPDLFARMSALTWIQIPKLKDIEKIMKLFRKHPRRKQLHVQLTDIDDDMRKLLHGKGIKINGSEIWWDGIPPEAKVGTGEEGLSFAERIANSLVDPQAAFRAVAERFSNEGDAEGYKKALGLMKQVQVPVLVRSTEFTGEIIPQNEAVPVPAGVRIPLIGGEGRESLAEAKERERRAKEAAQVGLLKTRLEELMRMGLEAGTTARSAADILLKAINSGKMDVVETTLFDLTKAFPFDAGKDTGRILDELLTGDLTTLLQAMNYEVVDKVAKYESDKEAVFKAAGIEYTPALKNIFDAWQFYALEMKKQGKSIVLDASSWGGMSENEIAVMLLVMNQVAASGDNVLITVGDGDDEKAVREAIGKHLGKAPLLKGKVLTGERGSEDYRRRIKNHIAEWNRIELISARQHIAEYDGIIELANIALVLVSDGRELTSVGIEAIKSIASLKEIAEKLETGELRLLEILDIKTKTIDEKQEAFMALGFQA